MGGLIPNRKQSKEKIGKLNSNPYHKDYFEYDYELDAFSYIKNQYMYFFANILNNTKIQKN